MPTLEDAIEAVGRLSGAFAEEIGADDQAALAHALTLLEAQRWRPIAECPEEWKDGRMVELYSPEEHPCHVMAEWIDTPDWADWAGWCYADEALRDISPEGPEFITHVRLPTPPEGRT